MSTPSRTRSNVAKAQKAEAVGDHKENVSFEFDGKTYRTVAAVGDSPELYDMFEAMENNRVLTAVRLLLDDESYTLFKSTKPSPTKGYDLIVAGLKALGAEAGE